MNHKAREVPTDRRLIIARALLLSTNPYPYPRPGFNLPMGPGGPGGPGGPVGPWGQWLLVSVKVLDSNESPGGGKIASERSWGSGPAIACHFCHIGSDCPTGQPAARTGPPVPAARYREEGNLGSNPTTVWLATSRTLSFAGPVQLHAERESGSCLLPTVYCVSGFCASRIMRLHKAGTVAYTR